MTINLDELKYSEILRLNKKLAPEQQGAPYNISVLSNIITTQLNDVLECALRSEGVNAHVSSGNYDNIVQDSSQVNQQNCVILFWELANIMDGLQSSFDITASDDQLELIQKIQSEISYVLNHLSKTSLVVMNKFSALVFDQYAVRSTAFETLASKLNQYLHEHLPENVILIDIDKIIARLSVDRSVDFRYYYSSKVLYSVDFYKEYVKVLRPLIGASLGRMKKAIIFDCDNTLWKGVLGEDGAEGIEMSSDTADGQVYREIQEIAIALANNGILVGLCSKNNLEDVEKVLNEHPDIKLKNEYISIKKINWDDKVANLKEIAAELNIGLDSLVFVDDSNFEVQFVNDQLPEVQTIQVPKKIYRYPQRLRSCLGVFYSSSQTSEDSKRVLMYKQQKLREGAKQKFEDIEGYLQSLELKMVIHKNDSTHLKRMAQLTQKTNQFNLTTLRYTEADIQNFLDDELASVYVFGLSDKFGDYGLTGLSIVTTTAEGQADINVFLMSCRVIGRNIEQQFLAHILEDLMQRGVTSIQAKYIRTLKNDQVSNFYDKLGFSVTAQDENQTRYVLDLEKYTQNKINYIEVNYG